MTKKSTNWEKIGIILSTVIASIAIIIAIKSCSVSSKAVGVAEESNILSKEALENSKNFFLTEQRPYLVIEPKKFTDTNSFLKILQSQDDKQIIIELSYSIKNVGLLPAKNISFPKVVVIDISTKDEKSPNIMVNMPIKGITLGHEQSCNITCSMKAEYQQEKNGIKKIFDEYNSEKFNLTMQIVLFYENELESGKKYNTLAMYKISKNKVIVVKSEME